MKIIRQKEFGLQSIVKGGISMAKYLKDYAKVVSKKPLVPLDRSGKELTRKLVDRAKTVGVKVSDINVPSSARYIPSKRERVIKNVDTDGWLGATMTKALPLPKKSLAPQFKTTATESLKGQFVPKSKSTVTGASNKLNDHEYHTVTGEIMTKLKRTTPGIMAHEYGHVLDFNSPGATARRKETIKALKRSGEGGMFGRKPGTSGKLGFSKKTVLHNYRNALLSKEAGMHQIQEEINASKNGMAILRKTGATPKQINTAAKELTSALGTYKNGRNVDIYKKLLLAPPKVEQRMAKHMDELNDLYKSGVQAIKTK